MVIREGLRTWRLDRTLADSKHVFIDLETGAPKTISTAELQRELLAKRMRVVQEYPVALEREAENGIRVVQTVEDLPLREQRSLRYRVDLVKYLRKRGLRKGMREGIKKALEAWRSRGVTEVGEDGSQRDDRVPSASTAMAWMRRFEESGSNPLSLLSGYLFRKPKERLPALVLEIGRRKVRDFYCTRKRPTARATKLLINKELAEQAARGRIDASSAEISTSTLRRLILEIPPYERSVARYGPDYARSRWRYSLGGISAPRVLARYEIDHTILDLVVIHDFNGMPMGRPTITVVVDSRSGYIAGFFISFWSAGLASALSAVKVAISPKNFYTEHAQLTHPWLALGIPDLIVVDNGLEFHSTHFHAAAMHLGTDVLHCAVRQPWLKPMVERTIGEINGFLPASGRVEKPLNNYIPIKPEKNACITFGALCAGLLKAVVDVHPFETNERSLDLAYDLYSQGLSTQLAPRLASSHDELDLIMAASKTLSIGNEGAIHQYLRYNSKDLQQMRRRIGENYRTRVKFNAEDMDHVWVQDPVEKTWLKVPSCQPEYTDGLSVVQHRSIRDFKKKELTLRNAAETLQRGRIELADMWSSSIRHGKRQKPKFLKSVEGFTSTSVLAHGSRKAKDAGATAAPIPLSKGELMPLPRELETYAFD